MHEECEDCQRLEDEIDDLKDQIERQGDEITKLEDERDKWRDRVTNAMHELES